MGRFVQRVPLDFNAPMTAWAGYIRPSGGTHSCAVCEGRGQSPLANQLHKLWWGQGADYTAQGDAAGAHPWTAACPEIREMALRNVVRSPNYYVNARSEIEQMIAARQPETALVEADLERPEVEAAIVREGERLAANFNKNWMNRLSEADLTAILVAEHGIPAHLKGEFDRVAKVWVPFDPAPVFTARQLSAMNMLHFQIGQSACMDRVIQEMGGSWDCPNPDCDGGTVYDSPEVKAALDAWERTEPPEGEGWQMWQNVSDGPISPVFETPQALADWMAGSTRYCEGLTSAQWLKFIQGPGWAPSGGSMPGHGMVSGVEAAIGEVGDPAAKADARLESIFDDVDA
jgi:hypothetical protein